MPQKLTETEQKQLHLQLRQIAQSWVDWSPLAKAVLLAKDTLEEQAERISKLESLVEELKQRVEKLERR